MADKTAEEKAQAQREAEAARAERARARQADEEPTYHVDRLLSDDAFGLTGHPAHVVAGALELAGGSKKNYTHAEITDAVQAFLDHEVAPDSEEEQ